MANKMTTFICNNIFHFFDLISWTKLLIWFWFILTATVNSTQRVFPPWFLKKPYIWWINKSSFNFFKWWFIWLFIFRKVFSINNNTQYCFISQCYPLQVAALIKITPPLTQNTISVVKSANNASASSVIFPWKQK